MKSTTGFAYRLVALLSVLAFTLTAAAQPAAEPKPITVKGQGLTVEAARKDAMRNAIEQGGRNVIHSQSHVRNYELMYDAIRSKAEGIIKRWEPVGNPVMAADGAWSVTIMAWVSEDIIASTWLELQTVLDQVGRPRLVVTLQEVVDGEPQNTSTLESRLIQHLTAKGFDVYHGPQLEALKRTQEKAIAGGTALKGEDVAWLHEMQRLAKEHQAEIFITGVSRADYAEHRDVYGEMVVNYNCNTDLRVYDTDTGRYLASIPVPAGRGGARSRAPRSHQAAMNAFLNVADIAMGPMYQSIMEQWAARIGSGGEIQLTVRNVDFYRMGLLEYLLGKLCEDKMSAINCTLNEGVASCRIQTQYDAQTLAKMMSDPRKSFKHEQDDNEYCLGQLVRITGTSRNTLSAEWVAGPGGR